MGKPEVYFRTDANSSIGMGHLIRCSALAAMLKEDFAITFLTHNTPDTLLEKYLEPEFKKEKISTEDEIVNRVGKDKILVLDGYNFDSEYQLKVKQSGVKLVYIDDLKTFAYSADVIINQAENIQPSEYKTLGKTIFCLGPQYALLRKPFLEAAASPARIMDSIDSVFISFGGSDTDNITHKVLKVFSRFSTLKNIHVLTGPVNRNIANWKNEFDELIKIQFHHDLSSEEVCKLMQKCELALCPSSSLSLEICAAGLVLLIGTTAENQKGYYNALIRNSAALGVGEWQAVTEVDLYDKLIGIMRYDKSDINFFLSNQKAYIDGKSGNRLRNVFLELI